MGLFNGKYRTDSTRLKYWNYNWSAPYFLTICTHKRDHFFGEIKNNKMIANVIGDQVNAEWLRSLTLRPDMNLMLADYQLMPNHFHGIIVIGENKYNSQNSADSSTEINDKLKPIKINHPIISNETNHSPIQNKFGPQKKNLGSIIRGFKSSVTTYAKTINPLFKWQAKFHEHVIRDQDEYDRISFYIRNNPKNWKENRFY